MRRTFLPWHHHPAHPDVVVPVRVDPTGRRGPTPQAARCGRWRRVGPGWFVPASVDASSVEQRIVEAAVHLGAHGAVTGWAALRWAGARWFDGSAGRGDEQRAVTLATGDHGPGPAPGIAISEERLVPAAIVVLDGLRVTLPPRSVLFEVRHARDLEAAVEVVDMACFSDLVSLGELAVEADLLGTWTGIPQARAALPLADENAWSPPEVAMRLLWARQPGLGRPLTNRPVFDLSGKRQVTPDLIDPDAGVVGEYDGGVHLDRGSQRRDVRRDDLYRRLGLEQVTMTAPDLADPQAVVSRLVAAHERAARRPAGERLWTIEPPPWWRPTLTVDQRRRLSDSDRARLLRHRAA